MAQPVGTPGVAVEQQLVQPVKAEVQPHVVGVPQTLAVPAPQAPSLEVKTSQPISTVKTPEIQQQAVPVQDVPIAADTQIDFSGTESLSGNVSTIASQLEQLNTARMEVAQPHPQETPAQPVTPSPLQPIHTKQ